ILKLKDCSHLSCLPTYMRNLTNLRHLDITDCDKLTKMPIGMGKLISLRTLGLFIVGEESGCGITDLTHLSVQNKGSRHLANLRRLTISACPKLEFSHEDDADFQNLISLRFLGLNGLDKMTYLPPLPLLTSLVLGNCSAPTTLEDWMPNLTSLRSLRIGGCENLESLSDRLQQLTALTKLVILRCEI
ncbi:hypothetical protein MKW98_011379, partial [Papaver atlanticum]